jgi:hypothetical protein
MKFLEESNMILETVMVGVIGWASGRCLCGVIALFDRILPLLIADGE